MNAVAMENERALRAKLLEMPKPPVDDVVLSIVTQWKYVSLVVVLLAGLAGLFSLVATYSHSDGWYHWAMVLLAVDATPAVIAVGMGAWALTQGRKLRRMTAGEYYVHWKIGPQLWQRTCEHYRSKARWLAPALVAGGAIAGLAFAMAAFDDNNVFFGSAGGHFFGILGIGTAIGGGIGLYVRFLADITARLMRTRTPQVVIGPAGLYFTGQFWPTKTYGQELRMVRISEEMPGFLRFFFLIENKYGKSHGDAAVPFPPDEAPVAEVVCQLMTERARHGH